MSLKNKSSVMYGVRLAGEKNMFEQKFFKCNKCGNFLGLINNTGEKLVCCEEKMQELKANTSDGVSEKHVPEINITNDTVTVKVGSVLHPMGEEHHIEFIYLQTEHGGQRKCLKNINTPVVKFKLIDDRVIAVFAYCNLHGLWKHEI